MPLVIIGPMMRETIPARTASSIHSACLSASSVLLRWIMQIRIEEDVQ